MLRRTLIGLFVAAVAGGLATGCGGGRPAPSGAAPKSASSEMDPPAQAMNDTQLAAYAGHAKFPTTQAQDNWKVAAIVSKDRRTIKIYNFEPQPIRAVNLWVNGAYVQPIQGIPAQGHAAVRTDKLFNGLGDTFAKRSEEVTRVQIETKDGLYSLLGPTTE
jgi:hypothetical protein